MAKPPCNQPSAAERERILDEAGVPRLTLSFYKYHRLEDPRAFRDRLSADWGNLDVLGRIYVAREGINAQLSLPRHRLADFREYLEAIPFLKGIRLNLAVRQDDKSFLKLKIKVRDRIVADGIEDPAFDPGRVGAHLDARGFNRLIADPSTLLVDVRNHFESEIGHFPGALLPDSDTFRESLGMIRESLRGEPGDRNLVLYCTGGIRCEKASAWFRHEGFANVFQLEGGIIEYLRQVKAQGLENRFTGKNFVFDRRMAEPISGHVVSACHLCGEASDTHRNCANETCHVLFIQCGACAGKLDACCSEACRAFLALPAETRKALRKGRGAPKRYFKRSVTLPYNPETRH